METLIILVIFLALYFLPLIIANSRGHHNTASIGIINFFFGWTFIGWVVALAMAASHIPEEKRRHVS